MMITLKSNKENEGKSENYFFFSVEPEVLKLES